MSVVIRLRREGSTKRPTFRVVVADSHRPREGLFLEKVGVYYPRRKENQIELDLERINHWIKQGAKPSDTVRSLIRKQVRAGSSKPS